MSDDREQEILTLNDQLASTARAYERQLSRLRQEKQLAEDTLASLGGAVITTDANATVSYLNPAAEKLTGWPSADAAGHDLFEILRLVDADLDSPIDFGPCLEQGRKLYLSDGCTIEHRDGRVLSVDGCVAPIQGREGHTHGLVLAFDDVSDKRLTSLRLERAATYDTLTGLLNREAFDQHLKQALEASTSEAETGDDGAVLCYMDLDQFKVINDTCGHAAGEMLLQWIASLIRERVRDTDVLARLGGDEFALLLPGYSLSAAREVASGLHDALRNFRFIWQKKNFAVGMSVALVPLSAAFDDLADLMGAAEHACLMAKEKGRGRTQVYQHDDAEIRSHQGRMNWVVKLQQALDEDGFQLFWQRIRPAADAEDRRLFYEVLLRLRDGDTLHTPDEFLDVAERFDLMPAIDRWVVRNTLEILKGQSPEFLARLECCSINLSGASLGDDSLLRFIERELDRTGFTASKICFEITETAAVTNLGQARHMIERLSARRCRWALDDFGSGMSSYRYLRELPVHYLKIDGDIVAGLGQSPLSSAMVRSIHQIGHVLDVETIAEAVTSEAMFDELRQIGVDFAQGFWVERPRTIREREDVPEIEAAAVAI